MVPTQIGGVLAIDVKSKINPTKVILRVETNRKNELNQQRYNRHAIFSHDDGLKSRTKEHFQ